jgi:hypothetical protein
MTHQRIYLVGVFGWELPDVSLGSLQAVPLWAWGAIALLLLAGAYWATEENSASGVARRARRDSSRAAAGAGLVGLGVVGAVVGVADGLSVFLGQAGNLLLSSPGFLTQLALAGLGVLVVDGTLQPTAAGFAAMAGAVILVGLMLSEAG